MHFASDNAGPVAPEIFRALEAANEGHAVAYGADAATQALEKKMQALFEAPDARMFLVASGTATNVLALATLTRPWETIYCHAQSHISVSECNAPEFYTAGAKLTLVEGPSGKIDPAALDAALAATSTDQLPDTRKGPVSLTQVTDLGAVYSIDEIRAVTSVAAARGCACHMDGARFANALVALGCSPADMTWRAGIDALSFGGTKNGLMGAEAVLFFDPSKAYDFEHRRRRGAHLLSKQRFLAAQYEAYLSGDLWLELAAKANRAGALLAEAVRSIGGAQLLHPADANMLFVEWPAEVDTRLRKAGAVFYGQGAAENGRCRARLVTNWATRDADIQRFREVACG